MIGAGDGLPLAAGLEPALNAPRLPVPSAEFRLAGILTRSDLLAGHRENPQRRA
jgi:CBS-domain-containing membrane protein